MATMYSTTRPLMPLTASQDARQSEINVAAEVQSLRYCVRVAVSLADAFHF